MPNLNVKPEPNIHCNGDVITNSKSTEVLLVTIDPADPINSIPAPQAQTAPESASSELLQAPRPETPFEGLPLSDADLPPKSLDAGEEPIAVKIDPSNPAPDADSAPVEIVVDSSAPEAVKRCQEEEAVREVAPEKNSPKKLKSGSE